MTLKIEIFHVGIVGTNSYLVTEGEDAYLFDPGDEAPRIMEKVRGLNLKYIFLTHGHFDHLLAAEGIRKETGAKLVASKYARLDDEVACGFASFGLPGFKPLYADITVGEGDEIDGFTVMETPGHTPCSICLLKDGNLFSGDTLFAGSCGRCDLPGGDYEKMKKSLARLAELPDETKVYSGHGGATTIEREKRSNPYMYEAIR